MGSDTETMRVTIIQSLVIQVTWAQSGYWWMGQSGSFGGSENLESRAGEYAGVSSADNVVENVEAFQKPEKLQLQQPQDTPSQAAGYGNSYYGNQVSESEEADEQQQAQAPVISNDINERNSNYGVELPATECAVGWKCVNEIFCDETGTMVAFRVELTQQQKRNRGQLIPCMNQALGKFEVCCKKPLETAETVESLPVSDTVQSTQQISKQSLSPDTIISAPSTSSPSSPSSCPALGPLPPISACVGRESNCWSVGVRDLDCLDSALCCFDGCANVCLGRGPIAGNPGPQNNPRLPTTIREIIAPPPTQTQDASAANNLLPVVQQQVEQQSDFVFPKEDYDEAFGLPSPSQQFDDSRAQQNENPNIDQSLQTLNDVLSNQDFASNEPKLSPEPLSTTSTPFVQCPSAMKCVPRVNCDFNGVMVSHNVILSQIQEQQRVPLISCFNSARGNSVDVCCRDPNYKDPWPQMNNSGAPETVSGPGQQDKQSQAPVTEEFVQKVEKTTKKRRPGYGK